jgi:hypothetical protein
VAAVPIASQTRIKKSNYYTFAVIHGKVAETVITEVTRVRNPNSAAVQRIKTWHTMAQFWFSFYFRKILFVIHPYTVKP